MRYPPTGSTSRRYVALLTQETYQPLLDAGIEDSLGEAVDDLRDAALEKLREHAPAHEIIEVLEPVLEDDAHALVVRLWRALLVDVLA